MRQELLGLEPSDTYSDPEARRQTVLDRIETLKEALADSEFEPEAVKIKCAIAGFKSGVKSVFEKVYLDMG